MEVFSPVKPTVLVIDDSPSNLSLISGLLKEHYRVLVANSGIKGINIACANQPDIILLDVVMPDLDGYDVCEYLKQSPSTRNIPVLFLTSRAEIQDEKRGLEMGAVDYIVKPVSAPILLARLQTHLHLVGIDHQLRTNNQYLELEVNKRTAQVKAIQEMTILALANLAETRDTETGNHLIRTQLYIKALAQHLSNHPRFADYLTPDHISLISKLAPLHDIGKVGIPDRILLKPGKYLPEEFEVMKSHPTLGRNAIDRARGTMEGVDTDFFIIAIEIIYCHHEKWDGSGYPQGLVADEIPIPARLMALADVYDALISRRVYKAGMSHAQAYEIISAGCGKHFDPDVFEAFNAIQSQFIYIAERFADTESDIQAKEVALSGVLASVAPAV
ncbi:MAG: two-component system response regulator [Gallionella sp.]|nr:two-component system response regulator [Gallionella sp.]